jgi:hypothetical protein
MITLLDMSSGNHPRRTRRTNPGPETRSYTALHKTSCFPMILSSQSESPLGRPALEATLHGSPVSICTGSNGEPIRRYATFQRQPLSTMLGSIKIR